MSVGALLLLSPLFLVVAVLIKLDSRGPVFFRQVRMGANERVFRIHKFRTMVADAEERKCELVHLNMYATTTRNRRRRRPGRTRVGTMSVGAELRREVSGEG